MSEKYWYNFKCVNSEFYKLIKSLCINDTVFNLAKQHRIESMTYLMQKNKLIVTQIQQEFPDMIISCDLINRDELFCGAFCGGWYKLLSKKSWTFNIKYIYYAYQNFDKSIIELVNNHFHLHTSIKGAINGGHNEYVKTKTNNLNHIDYFFVEACMINNTEIIDYLLPRLKYIALVNIGFTYLCRHGNLDYIKYLYEILANKFGNDFLELSSILLVTSVTYNLPFFFSKMLRPKNKV